MGPQSALRFHQQSYLITSRWLVGTMAAVQGLDERTARKMDFYTRQFADAFAPSNFLWTNPEVLRATMESQGQNLARGFENFQRDLDRGDGKLQDHHERRGGVRARSQHRNHAGQGGFPERPDAADPVHADHRAGVSSGRC